MLCTLRQCLMLTAALAFGFGCCMCALCIHVSTFVAASRLQPLVAGTCHLRTQVSCQHNVLNPNRQSGVLDGTILVPMWTAAIERDCRHDKTLKCCFLNLLSEKRQNKRVALARSDLLSGGKVQGTTLKRPGPTRHLGGVYLKGI